MTKKELILPLKQLANYGGDPKLVDELLQEFLESNICIPRGENPHKHCEVIHAMAEGHTIQVLDEANGYVWKDDTCPTFTKKCQYRIKPQEPVYEWLYYDCDGKTDWLTDDEYELMISSDPMECYRANETKRIRK